MIAEHWLMKEVERATPEHGRQSVAVDVGANVGQWSAMLVQRFSEVVAIEPDSRATDALFSNPSLCAVEVIEAAIGSQTGAATLHRRRSPAHNSLLEEHPIGGEGGQPEPAIDSVEVDVYTLDDLFPDGADLVKIDIEGGEVESLRGCSEDGRWERATFIVECHNTLEDVSEQLERLKKEIHVVRHPFYISSHPGHCWAIGRPHGPLK